MVRLFISKNEGYFNLHDVYEVMRASSNGVYELSIKKCRATRTQNQNEYLWGCVYPILLDALLDAGWELTSTEQVHEFFKHQMAQDKVINRHTGEIMSLPTSTATMDTTQFSAYIDKLKDYASEYLGVEIPEADKFWKYNGKTSTTNRR